MNIPFSPPDITEEEIEEVSDTLRSGWITTGPKTKEFERQIAAWCQTERAVCLNSATACMEMTLRLFGVGPGDEVITTAYTYTATASAICHTGATLVLVDTGKDSFEMDYDSLERQITPATKAVMPVDVAGIPCDYDRIYEIIERKKDLFQAGNNKYQKALGRILVLADCAHGFGARIDALPAGQFADFTAFSFHAVKNLTTAEGGAVVWNVPSAAGFDADEIYQAFMLLSLHGQSKDALAKTKAGAWEYDILFPAYKCNMTDIMAAIGIKQLERYKEMLRKRQYIVEQYDRCCDELEIGHMIHDRKEMQSSRHLYITRISGIDEQQRGEIMVEMAQRGISCNVHYKPLPMMTAYHALGYKIEDYPNSYRLYQNEITLPLHTLLDKEDIDYVVENYKDVIARSKKTFFGFERMERSS